MEIDIFRFSSQSISTIGALMVDGYFECYTLEDKRRPKKIKNKTAIPGGRYRIKMRKHGRIYDNYKKFHWHEGTLEIEDVPDYTDVLIHIGNSTRDTSGCILVGDYVTNNKLELGFLRNSTAAYKNLYLKVLEAVKRNESIWLSIHDCDEMHKG